jgi:hypothetical protein
MPGSEEFIQSAVHALEAGGLVVWVKRGAVALAITALVVLYFYQFRGLSTSQDIRQYHEPRSGCIFPFTNWHPSV